MIGLDTTFIIDFLRGEYKAVALGTFPPSDGFCVTPINVYEVYLGIERSKASSLEAKRGADVFFNGTHILPLTMEAAQQAASISSTLLKEGNEIQATEALIAATFLIHGCPCVLTRDKDFERIPGLQVQMY